MIQNLPANVGNSCSIPGLRRSPEAGNTNPNLYCLENPMDRGPGGLEFTRHKESDTTSTHARTHYTDMTVTGHLLTQLSAPLLHQVVRGWA